MNFSSQSPYYDVEAGNKPSLGTYGMDVRAGFVRKVYSIVGVQLLVTSLLALLVASMPLHWVFSHLWLMWLSMGASVGLMLLMACSPQLLSSYPTNYALLGSFTVFEGILVGFVSSTYRLESVLLAVGATALIVCLLSVYAVTTKTDFSGAGQPRGKPSTSVFVVCLNFSRHAVRSLHCITVVLLAGRRLFVGMYLACAGLCLCVFGLGLMLLGGSYAGRMVYAALGALLMSFYIVYDTQLLMGDRAYSLGVDDYILGALMIYMDIINLFLMLLQLFGDRRD